jgi:hypothetical protein
MFVRLDKDNTYVNIFFAGYEISFVTWNMLTFLFIDYFALNYVLAGVITYLLNLVRVTCSLTVGTFLFDVIVLFV